MVKEGGFVLKYLGMKQLGTFRKLSVIWYDKSVGYEQQSPRKYTDKWRQVLDHRVQSLSISVGSAPTDSINQGSKIFF